VTTPTTNIIHIELDVNTLDETSLDALATAIGQNAPQGTLYAGSTAIQACVTTITASNTKYKAAGVAVIADQAKLLSDQQAQADARASLVTSVVQLKGLVETSAKSTADVKGTGFAPLEKSAPAPIAIPTGVDIFYPKTGHNRAKVSALQSGNDKRFGAQFCLDPLASNTWTDMAGDGKSHWLTGYKTGTVIWVRFRTVRGHLTSDWCTPVSVTIP
jgi:hypothetical protein